MQGFAGKPIEGSYTSGRVFADLRWTSGATGAVPASFTVYGPWFTSLTRTGTGAYTLALSAPWAGVLQSPPTFACIQGTYSASTGVTGIQLVEDHVSNTTTPELKFITTNAAGAVTDASSGDVLILTLTFQLVDVQ